MKFRRNSRTDRATAYRALYGTAAWRTRRRLQLEAEPLCAYCARLGKTVAARAVDHVVPHRGDPELFHCGALQSLCLPCHDSLKQSEERRGYSTRIGVDGYPLDPSHPAW